MGESFDNEGKLPAKIERVLDASVQTLSVA